MRILAVLENAPPLKRHTTERRLSHWTHALFAEIPTSTAARSVMSRPCHPFHRMSGLRALRRVSGETITLTMDDDMRSILIFGRRFILALIVAACRSEMASAPGNPVAPAAPAVLAVLAATSPTSFSATVGSTVEELPSVVARNSGGNPLSGVKVTFAITNGGGSIVGSTQPATVSTSANGVATLTSWILGSRAGVNEVTARSGSLPPVIFRATAVAGPPSALRKLEGDDQYAAPGTAVSIRPAVRVVDAYENALVGVGVTFSVGNEDGTLTGAAVTTDSRGIAAVGSWTLGSGEEQRLTVTSAALAPVVFIAAAVQGAATCPVSGVLSAGIPTSSELSARSCRDADGRLLETFSMVARSGEAYEFTLTSSAFDSYLELRDARGRPVAGSASDSVSQLRSRLKVLLPAGVFTVVATTARPAAEGKFSVTYGPASPDVSGCEAAGIVRGVTTAKQSITQADCVVSPTRSEHRYRVWAAPGASLYISLEDWSYSDQAFEVTDGSGRVLAASRVTTDYNYDATFTAPAEGYYLIRVLGGSYDWGIVYVLTVR